jgi:hypothetical protein
MTKAQFRKKYRGFVRDQAAWMNRFAEAALESGAFDLEGEPDDYVLVKDVFCAACERLASGWGHGPLRSAGKKRVKQIRANVPVVR